MKLRNSFILTACIFISAVVKADDTASSHTWEPVELSFKAAAARLNPYIETISENSSPYLTAEFECNSCAVKKITIPGFWDGGNTWKVRFSAPEPGSWTYTTSSPDKRLNGNKGTIEVTAWTEKEKEEDPCRRGFIYVNETDPRAGRYFIYSDSTPFLWIGDTWWNWTKKELLFEDFKKLVDTRSQQGFSVGQLFFPGNGWEQSSSMLDPSYTMPDFEHLRKTEEMIRYANEKGITVWIHAWWTRKDMNKTIGGDKIIRWWKYVVDRLSAYNVIWVLAGEYNMFDYGGLGLDFWNKLGQIVQNEDPYKRIISAHPTPPGWDGGDGAPQWSTAEVLNNESWFSYNQSQSGHGKWRNEMIPGIVSEAYHMTPAKPIVVTEPWYEFIEGNPTAMDIRFGAWSAMLSGAAGHSYGGGHVWRAQVPYSPSGDDTWPWEKDFKVNTLLYPGAQSVSFMAGFLRSIHWWKLDPHPELLSENPSDYCSADIGKEYLVYLRYGGRVILDLKNTGTQTNFTADWIDLTTGQKIKTIDITGGRNVAFKPPEDYPGNLHYKDWLLHVYR